MTEWKQTYLREIITIKNGKDHKALHDGEYPVYGSGGIMRYVDKYLYDKESVLLPRKGTLNNIQYANTPFWTVDTCYYTEVNTERVLPYFLYNCLRQYDIEALNTGSAVPSMTFEKYYSIQINLPNLDTQRRIAEVLSRYDALIENYQRQIKLLEEAAQRLYKEWFVDLRFPGHQSTPIINNLPQSWQKKKLGEIVKTTSGGTPSRGKPEYYTGDILWVKTKELNDSFILDTEEKISIEAINKSSAKILPSGSLLLAMYGATIGKLGIASKKMACNQACCVFLFDANDVFRWFLYNWLIINRSFLISQGKGAAQPNLSQDMIKNFEAIIPDTPLLEKYHRMVTPLYERIKNNQVQIRNLSEARDRLLPKLMSAEIEV